VRSRTDRLKDVLLGILLLFLNRKLNFDKNLSTAVFHINELLGFLIPVFGAIIADSYLGIYKTITWMSLVFACGCFIIAVGAIEALNLPA
jgi:dipeptide/tripeptide permease